jgi:hypothetical protein
MALSFLEDICMWQLVRFNEIAQLSKNYDRQGAEL